MWNILIFSKSSLQDASNKVSMSSLPIIAKKIFAFFLIAPNGHLPHFCPTFNIVVLLPVYHPNRIKKFWATHDRHCNFFQRPLYFSSPPPYSMKTTAPWQNFLWIKKIYFSIYFALDFCSYSAYLQVLLKWTFFFLK